MADYPEHEKLQKITLQSQACGEFLDWLQSEKGVTLCTYNKSYEQFYPLRVSITEVLGEFFEIDLEKIEQEKRAMLDEIRRQNG